MLTFYNEHHAQHDGRAAIGRGELAPCSEKPERVALVLAECERRGLGVAELLQSAQLIYARTYETIPLLLVASIWYLVMTLLLSYPQSKLEQKYSRTTSRLPRNAKPVVLTDPEGAAR